jgi:hypothetical protein
MKRIQLKKEDTTTILPTEENIELKRIKMEITFKKLENH